ncbi:hypothetical protein E7T09_13500 [Deinococcus sp. KSM4-11]|uniref:hypothetical protein n=1 Tax=Deinococcus sp. KSM4-11 TaxID=2568654 RepID=UPI0010A3A9F4|nr:hypothetical protein [Deinococcus sp. KSM4-11]THF86221.1 hypothetical protein E7T09_13500 [Deinococcus sp. KSM4-11]
MYGELAHILTFAERYFVEIYSDDSMNHAAVLSANYLYFVYTQDSYLKAIVSASPRHGPSKAVSKFLTTGEVWGFRNAFAHGQWRYVGSGRHPDIEYREDGKKEGRILILTPEKLQLWHWLSRTVLGLWAARIAYLRQPIQHPGHS